VISVILFHICTFWLKGDSHWIHMHIHMHTPNLPTYTYTPNIGKKSYEQSLSITGGMAQRSSCLPPEQSNVGSNPRKFLVFTCVLAIKQNKYFNHVDQSLVMTNFVLTILVCNKGAYRHSRWRHVLCFKTKRGSRL
jgi:hypothetical protein